MTLFYAFGAVAVIASLLVIAQRNPIYSVLLLIASFGALSGCTSCSTPRLSR